VAAHEVRNYKQCLQAIAQQPMLDAGRAFVNPPPKAHWSELTYSASSGDTLPQAAVRLTPHGREALSWESFLRRCQIMSTVKAGVRQEAMANVVARNASLRVRITTSIHAGGVTPGR
jgi:hypothetical protein